jgi:hypothetical protein
MQTQRLHKAAHALADLLSITRDPWWIFGGAAMALLGVESEEVKDIDVLISAADAGILTKAFGFINHADSGHNRFRSSWFAKLTLDDMPVEILAEFQVGHGDHWERILPVTRHQIRLSGASFYTPEPQELADIFEKCARPKDLARATRLRIR